MTAKYIIFSLCLILFCIFLNSQKGMRQDSGVVFSTVTPGQKGLGLEFDLVEFACSPCICEGCIGILWLPPIDMLWFRFIGV